MPKMNWGSTAALLGLSVLLAAPCSADQPDWFSGLVAAVERDRASASALDSSILSPFSTGPGWSTTIQAPWSLDAKIGSLHFDPCAVVLFGSPAEIDKAFSWKAGLGVGASFFREKTSTPLLFALGPLVSAQARLRFVGAEGMADSPSERLKGIELAARLRENDRMAVERLLAAADLAARSAAALAEAEFAEARAGVLERKLRRVEIDMGAGRLSKADYAEAGDALTRAQMEAKGYRQAAGSYGRGARILALIEAPDKDVVFPAEDLYRLGLALEGLLAGADPAKTAAAAAAAPWEMRIAELRLEAANEAPCLAGEARVLLATQVGDKAFAPSGSGSLGLSIPIDGAAGRRSSRADELARLKAEVQAAAGCQASLRFAESRRKLAFSKERLTALKALAAERESRLAAWARLSSSGSATAFDVLAAQVGLSEARAALDREKAAFFLASVEAFASSGLSVQELAAALSKDGADGLRKWATPKE